MDTQELHDRGLALRTEMFGREAVEKRTAAFGEFGKPLQHVINAYAYGDVWQRSALPLATKSLAMVAMMAAAGHANELRVHLKGALKNGCERRADPGDPAAGHALLRDTGRERGASRRRRCAARGEAVVTLRRSIVRRTPPMRN